MKSKIVKSSVAVILMLIIIFSYFNISNATIQISERELYPKEEIVCLSYNGIRIGIAMAVYMENNIEYPAYCLNREAPGVNPTDGGYGVTVEGYITNNDVYKALVNGYPYYTPEELGCANELEAFAATKMASYHMMYAYDLDRFVTIGEEGKRVFAAMKEIIRKANESNISKETAKMTINEIGDWKVDDKDCKYISKEYKVETTVPMGSYIVTKEEGKEVKITDLNNVEKNEFKRGDNFKILLPAKELSREYEFKLKVISKVDTKPIYFGRSKIEGKQDYALTGSMFEDTEGEIIDTTPINNTSLKLFKQDGETKEPIKGVEFKILDENDKVIYSGLKTDEEGYCVINTMQPGTYYIEEITTQNDYEKYEDKIKVEIKWNEEFILTVNNFKKKKEKIKIEQEKEYGEVSVLPRTGF